MLPERLRRFFRASACLTWVLFASADYPPEPALVATTEPLSPREEQAAFHLPPGFTIELLASEPEIHKPMNLNFDAHGRLFVTSSLEYPFPAPEGQIGRDGIQMITGLPHLPRVSEVVHGLNIPIGVTPVPGGLIYYSIPRIYRANDQGGQSHADSRLLYGTFGFGDTHGMASSFTRWIDGWIYACHGFSNTSEVAGADGQLIKMQSGNTFRMRADGSHAEPFTFGQVNPFGLCFDPLGNLFSADCHSKPIYQLLRGGLYPHFGRAHDGLGFGPEMIDHSHGSTGIAGVVYYAADHFPPDYQGTVFIGNPVTGKINHDRLEPHGSTLKAIELPDFLTCDDPWFRPVDLKLGPDGALYIADFYNRIIGHYEVSLQHPGRDRERGRVWRVVYTGVDGHAAAPAPLADLAQLSSQRLVELLGSPNLALRVLATEQLAARREPAVAEDLLSRQDATPPGVVRRAHALWLGERTIPGGLREAQIRALAEDPDRLVRVHVVKLLADRGDWSAAGFDVDALVRGKLTDPDAFVRRAAVDALARHPAAGHLADLLNQWAQTPPDDTHLVYTLRLALRGHLAREGMYASVPPITASEPAHGDRVADVSLGVHTPEAAEFLLGYLGERELPDGMLSACAQECARYLNEGRLGELFTRAEREAAAAWPRQRELLLALHRGMQSRGGNVPESVQAWATRLALDLLGREPPPEVSAGIDLAREMRLLPTHEPLLALAANGSRVADLRPAALDACLACNAEATVPLLATILGDASEPLPLRQKSAQALGSIPADPAREALQANLRTAPDRLAIEIALSLSVRPEGGEHLLQEVAEGKASAFLLQDGRIQERLKAAKLNEIDARLEKLLTGLPSADERIAQLIEAKRQTFTERQPDLALGETAFKKTCAACHRLKGQGGKVGPDLDGVGLRGIDRLLEDLLDPSRNVDKALRATVISTVDGLVIQGLLLREEGNVLVLADAMGKEIRVSADQIEERSISNISPMPGNVVDIVQDADFYNLLGFLMSQRQAPQPAQP